MVAIWTTTFHATNTQLILSVQQRESSCRSIHSKLQRINFSLYAAAQNFQIADSHLISETYFCKPSQGIQKISLLNSLRGKYFYISAGHTKRRSFSSSLFVPKVTVEWLALLSCRFESQSKDRHLRCSYFSVALYHCITRPFQFMTDLHPTARSLKTKVLSSEV